MSVESTNNKQGLVTPIGILSGIARLKKLEKENSIAVVSQKVDILIYLGILVIVLNLIIPSDSGSTDTPPDDIPSDDTPWDLPTYVTNNTPLPLSAFEESSLTYDATSLTGGVLLEDTEVEGILYAAGTVLEFYPGGETLKGTLAEDTLVNDVLLQGGSEIEFTEWGQATGVLASGFEVLGIPIPSGSIIQFFYDGDFELTFGAPTPFDGITFSIGTTLYYNYSETTTDISIQIKSSESTELDGDLIAENSNFIFDWNGDLEYIVLGGLTTINGIPFAETTLIKFDSVHKLRGGVLGASHTFFGTLTLPIGTTVYFNSDENLYKFEVTTGETIIQGHTFPSRVEVRLDPNGNGNIYSLVMPSYMWPEVRTMVENGINYKISANFVDRLYFHPNGQISEGLLAELANIEGTDYSAGTRVYFDNAGTLTGTA